MTFGLETRRAVKLGAVKLGMTHGGWGHGARFSWPRPVRSDLEGWRPADVVAGLRGAKRSTSEAGWRGLYRVVTRSTAPMVSRRERERVFIAGILAQSRLPRVISPKSARWGADFSEIHEIGKTSRSAGASPRAAGDRCICVHERSELGGAVALGCT